MAPLGQKLAPPPSDPAPDRAPDGIAGGVAQPLRGELEELLGADRVLARAGDIVRTPVDEWHWHGAAPDHFMTHLSITEAVPGDTRPEADWGEHVTDDEYRGR